jgi:arylsulfatase
MLTRPHGRAHSVLPMTGAASSTKRPNVLLVVTDQERERSWVPDDLWDSLVHRRRLRDAGMELRGHYTHSSPCSPSRATLLTGQHVPEHGVTDNVFVDPVQPDLHTATRTIGHVFRAAGYRTAYLGKWHLSYGNPDIERYGFSDWSGEDWAWTGLAGTGAHFDEIIAAQAAAWLGAHGASADPWLLVVGLVNPHDVAWFPADQPDYQAAHVDRTAAVSRMLPTPIPGAAPIPIFGEDYPARFDLPANFGDDLTSKPAVQHAWRWEENHSMFGWLDLDDEDVWRRCLDYYWRLHELNDEHVGTILDALVAAGAWDDTVVALTSDHGEQAGGHGLRGKGPFAYEEIMHIPLVVHAPGVTAPGSTSDTLTSAVDLAPTLCALAGVGADVWAESMSGVDLTPVLSGAASDVRDHVLFAQAQGWHPSCLAQRYALRGVFDGRHKYVRYFGVGGGCDNLGRSLDWAPEMRFGPDAAFGDQEHELYDLADDPGELHNLAHDPGRRAEVHDRFGHLLDLEEQAYRRSRPPGPGGGSTHSAQMLDQSGFFD